MEEKLLEGKFFMFPSCKYKYEVIVTRQNLMFTQCQIVQNKNRAKSFRSILMENIIGCRIYESKVKNDHYCCFNVVALIKNKKGQRQKQEFTFCVLQSNDKLENLTITEIWARTIVWLAKDSTISPEELEAKEHFPPQKKYLILINPKSGKGKSLELFKNVIEPILQDAMIYYKVIVTEYSGHCKAWTIDFNYGNYDAVVICSGDGLIYEYINGLMKRADWKEAFQLPIGILPTGSGNALAASLCHAAKEEFGLVNSLYVLLKGHKHPMDLFSAQNYHQTVYGFLSVAWGFISDVDIESERYRALGAIRFTVGALQRIMGLRHYHGSFYYIPIDTNNHNNGRGGVDGDNTGVNDVTPVKFDVTRNSSIEEEIHNFDSIKLNTQVEQSSVQTLCNGDNNYGPTSSLPSLDTPLGQEWQEIKGEYVLLCLCSLSHLGSDMHSSPGICCSDGILDAQYVLRGTDKKTMVDLMGAFETGKHIDYPDVKRLHIKSYRLVPGMECPGHVAVDGEEIEYGPVQGEILPSLANIVLLKR